MKMKVNGPNALVVPSQTNLVLRMSMDGLKASLNRSRMNEFTPSEPTIRSAPSNGRMSVISVR